MKSIILSIIVTLATLCCLLILFWIILAFNKMVPKSQLDSVNMVRLRIKLDNSVPTRMDDVEIKNVIHDNHLFIMIQSKNSVSLIRHPED